MLQEWLSLLSSVIVLVSVYYAFSKNSDSAKKFILIIVIGIFLYEVLNKAANLLSVIFDLGLWGRNQYNIIPLVDVIVFSLQFIFLLNHFKKAEKTLYILMVIYFLIDIYYLRLFYY